MKEKLLQKIDELNDEYVKIWEDVCNIESPTHYKAGVDAVGEYFIRYANERGWKVEVFEQERAGNVVTITMNPDANEAPIAFSGHMDTVHEVGSFGNPPVRIEGDMIYGPGVTDCKGGLIVGFLAMDALDKIGYKKRPISMYLQSDEEGGGKFSGDATILHICEKAQGSIGFFNLENGMKDSVCIGRKGIASFEFTVTGVEAHSAGCATNGSNAILEAAYKIIELEKFKDPKGLTCCCAIIKGGTKHNIVPGECKFVANVRFATNAELDEFKAFCDKICADIKVPGCTCSWVLPRVRPAMEYCDRNLDLVNKINEIWKNCGFSELKPVTNAGGTDAAFASAAGIPSVDSMGNMGGKIHTTDEFGIISSLASQAKRLALAALYL
ncbi:MAG: M20 family metallopeptidase [Ruminococcaceae bacterium]|nr:M20 family metallopeptidase [Oscillospiraceae bacterium]